MVPSDQKEHCKAGESARKGTYIYPYKALHGIIDIDVQPNVYFYMETDLYSFTHYDDLSLRKTYARTNILKYSYFHRVVDTWNSLPEHIRRATSVNSL